MDQTAYRCAVITATSTTVGKPYKANLNGTHEFDEAVNADLLRV